MRTVRVNLSEGRWFRGTVASETAHYTTVIVTDIGTVDECLGAHKICSNDRIQEEGDQSTGWVSFMIRFPEGDVARVHAGLVALDFQETDWSQDYTTVTWGPCEPPRSD